MFLMKINCILTCILTLYTFVDIIINIYIYIYIYIIQSFYCILITQIYVVLLYNTQL